ncbi:hypothetical protein NGM33_02680 [Nocardiopsis dassonvillei]|uniref:aspartate racemase/maleate isomerase family protein n=1 Tax=Nocardiopsis dassonvillei TaxID=2014 RepID=UPI0020A4B8C4|nr:hypothetical protein [Nocardiopsis dassonvillei]MCP3012219.1 hypothetical protein [Nocardiopsis dassonvillei]
MRTRLGILVIHNDPVPESEIWRSAEPDTSVHTARFWTPRPFGTEFTGLELEELFSGTGLDTAVRQLGDLGVHALGYCFTSSSVFGGTAFDAAFTEHVEGLSGGIPTVTAGQAIREELSGVGGEGIAVVAPPWFSDRTVEAVRAYVPVRVRQVIRFELPSEWNGIERPDLFDRGARFAVDQTELEDQVLRRLEPGIGTVLVPGGGFASLTAAQRLRRSRGLRVVSSNSALLRAMERRAVRTVRSVPAP